MSLTISKLKIRYPRFTLSVQDLTVDSGAIVAVVGRSGSGKSTLLQGVAGFAECDESEILNCGISISKLPSEKRKTAMVFQRGSLFTHLSVRENVEFGLCCQGVSSEERQKVAEDWLARLGLSELGARLPHEISGGQAQRVALARAFAVGFPALLLDEPFSALDRDLREQLRPILKTLVRETKVSALLVTHDPADALACADRVIVIEEGAIVESGWVEDLKRAAQSPYGRKFFNLEGPG